MQARAPFLVGVVMLCGASIVSAQNGVHNVGAWFIRGKVTAISPTSVTLALQNGGAPETIPLRSGWTVGVITPSDESVLAPGHVVNIVEVDWKGDTPRALYVDYFVGRNPPPMPPSSGGPDGVVTKGRNWAQLPGKDEFGAWGALGKVLSVNKAPGGLLVVTELSEGPHTSFVPDGVRKVRNEPGQQSMVTTGVNANVLMRRDTDGKPIGTRILIGANGSAPPM